MAIVLWGRPNSLNVHKILWLAAELELDFEHIYAGQHYGLIDQPEFLARNPNGLIPVLQDHETVLWESHTILRYLTEVYGQDSVWIANPQQRFQAEKWLDWYLTTIFPVFSILFRHLVRLPAEQRDLAAIAQASVELEKLFDILDGILSKQTYLSGQQFGIADIPLGLAVHHWFNFDIPRQHPQPHLKAWIEKIRARPYFLKIATVL
ncbi:glutathione S-transferase family protein [Acinetobacter larvae]|uniref:Glutathione S-transferase n=1 Tax=Acinetobacter larvae TaxID=1789224 RepID=A0A1B2LVR4_9GAMM|nr:glutathione S-transferase [Acinetobacter larvae]AOA57041.1 glutathione S-transferase [Acinetobacter larvae]